MSRNLDDLNKQLDHLQFVIVILISELKRVGGRAKSIEIAERVLASIKPSVVNYNQTNPTERSIVYGEDEL
jgi:hypothetical protein